MPIIKSKKKHVRQTKTRTARNTLRRRAMKTAIKDLTTKSSESTTEQLSVAYKAIDKAAKSGIIKKNTASRKKSKVAKVIADK